MIIFAEIIGMETSLSKELEALSGMIARLTAQRDEAQGRLREALDEITDLRRMLEDSRKELHKSKLDIEFLTLSHKLADTPQKLAEARATVRRMLAGVDKALALLKGDIGL